MPETIVASASAWERPAIDTYLGDSVLPCRLSCITGEGFPQVTSLWFRYDGEALWFSVQRSTRVSRWLEREPRCGFEVAGDRPPYRGVRGRGHAVVAPARDGALLDALIERYLGERDAGLAHWLKSRQATEMSIRVTPCWLTAWDFGARMSGP